MSTVVEAVPVVLDVVMVVAVGVYLDVLVGNLFFFEDKPNTLDWKLIS